MAFLYEQKRFAHVALSEATQALLGRSPEGPSLMRLNRMLLCDAYVSELKKAGESIEPFDMPGEPAPILFAANFLRTRLGNLGGCLDDGTLFCYYRVLRELYNLHETNWALGAARPGELTGKPSVFVTTECTRAIGYFARLMENTAQFLKRIYETRKYIEHVKLGRTIAIRLSLDFLKVGVQANLTGAPRLSRRRLKAFEIMLLCCCRILKNILSWKT